MKNSMLILLLSVSTACSTVTMIPQGQKLVETPPTYETSLPFFLDGIVGVREVDVKEVCGKRSVRQMQTQFTVLDSLLTIVTLTIYAPRSIKIWCVPERS